MAFDLTFNSAISGFDTLSDVFGKYIVSPATNFGLGGFIFDVEGDQKIDLSADITDHYTEANYSVQDHIAIRPKRVRLETYVGELVQYAAESQAQQLQKLVRKLTVINSYLPQLSAGAGQAREIFESNVSSESFSNFVDPALNLYGFLKNALPPTTKQAQAYQYFKALMESKTLVSLQTPFEFCTNMAIEAVFANQREDSRYISTFGIVLKEIRKVATKTISIGSIVSDITNRAGVQNSAQVDGGRIQGTAPTSSLGAILDNSFGSVF